MAIIDTGKKCALAIYSGRCISKVTLKTIFITHTQKHSHDHNTVQQLLAKRSLMRTSGNVLSDTSVGSPQKVLILTIKNSIDRIKIR